MLVRRELPRLPVPFREFAFPTFREVMEWDPFRKMMPFFETEPEREFRFAPTFDVKETKEGYIFKADLPGIAEKDVEVTLSGNRLTVSGKREEEKKEKGDVYYTWERSYGAFTRSFTLPEDIDPAHVEAELKGGVLTIVAAKSVEHRPQKIPVKGTIEKTKVTPKEEAKA